MRLRTSLAALIVLLSFLPAQAKIFTVVNASDSTNVLGFRTAIIFANAMGGDNTLILTQPVYKLTLQGADEDGAFTGDLDITNGTLTIIGQGNSPVIIDATGLGDRVFQVMTNTQLTLSNLVIIGGNPPGGNGTNFEDGEPGGAIYNQGTLLMENCVLSNNAAGDAKSLAGGGPAGNPGDGGAIYSTGLLVMSNCIVTMNKTGGQGIEGANGGGICNFGTCFLSGCVFSGNATSGGGVDFSGQDGGNGGGICNFGDLTLVNCTVAGNTCGGGGAGTSFNGTINGIGSGGGAGGSGGGIYSEADVVLAGCTINGNTAGNGGNGAEGQQAGTGGAGGDGGGIYIIGGTLSMESCTVGANSSGIGGSGGDGHPSAVAGVFAGDGGNGGSGGGIFCKGTMDIIACTISENHGGAGGSGGNVILSCCPETNDLLGFGGSAAVGGVFFAPAIDSAGTLHDTIIALNSPGVGGAGGQLQTNGGALPGTKTPDGPADLSGTFTSIGYNLIGITDGGSGITNGINNDLAGSIIAPLDPRLRTLANNGGPTATFNLLSDSPAIDAGDDALLVSPFDLTTDQRGESRLFGAHVDIGALEYDGLNNGIVQPPQLKIGLAGNSTDLTFTAATQRTYRIFTSTNLHDWTLLGTATENPPGFFGFQDSTTNGLQRFYEVRSP